MASVNSNQLSQGMIILLDQTIYRVESVVRVSVPKGTPFIKARLQNLSTDSVIEKNLKVGQMVEEVALNERSLEFLYPEGSDFLFLDLSTLDQVFIPSNVVGDKVNYLKESVEIRAYFYGDKVFSVELPQFLELMVTKTEASDNPQHVSNAVKLAYLETGATLEVPMFIESGDVVKVDTQLAEYVQRI
jgi:elongation factor P